MALTYSINYEANKEIQKCGQVTKQNNQLFLVELYSLDSTNLKVTIGSANFGIGNYPDLAKHRWIIRTHHGFFLRLNFKTVEVEVDVDTIDVYKLRTNGDTELVDQVNVAKQLIIKSNQVEIVLRSDCTVNRSGFQATVQSIKSSNQTEKTKTKAISTAKSNTKETIRETPATQNKTPEIPTIQKTTTPQTVENGKFFIQFY